MPSTDTDDNDAAVEWLETVYFERISKMHHPNQHGIFNFRIDHAHPTPGQDAAHWPAQDGFRKLSLAGCDRSPEPWFIEFFYRGWHDEIPAPEATQLRSSASVAGDGIRERHRHAERQVQEDPVPVARGTESLVLV